MIIRCLVDVADVEADAMVVVSVEALSAVDLSAVDLSARRAGGDRVVARH